MATRVLIAGYYGFGNLGDEAILASIVHELKTIESGISFCIASGDPEHTLRNHDVSDAVKHTDIRGLEREIAESDLVLIGGGGIFEDHNEFSESAILTPWHSGLSYYAGIPLLSSILKTPCVMFQVGIGPLSSSISKELTKQSILLSSRVLVRDQHSLVLVEDLVGGSKEWIQLSADPAFLIQSKDSAPPPSFLAEINLDPDKPILGVAVRPWIKNKDQWERELASAINAFSKMHNIQVLFIPFHRYPWVAEDDVSKSSEIAQLLNADIAHSIAPVQDGIDEIVQLISQCKLLIGMRYHSIIFSMTSGVPFVAMSYDKKVSNLVKEAGILGANLEPVQWCEDFLLEEMLKYWHRKEVHKHSEFVSEKFNKAKFGFNYLMSEFKMGRLIPREHSTAVYKFARERMHQLVDSIERESFVRNQRDYYASSKNQLERDIASIRESIAVRVLDKYWQLINQLIPEGTSAKVVYRRIMGYLRRLLPGPTVYSFEGDKSPESGLPYGHRILKNSPIKFSSEQISPDPRVELLRFEDRVRQSNANKLLVVLSTTDLIGSEGQRPTNLVKEFSDLGIPVIYSSFRWGRSKWTAQEQIDKNILHLPMDIFLRHASEITSKFQGYEKILLFEFPYPEFIPLLSRARSTGWISIYDAIDDWEAFAEKGMVDWFDSEIEGHFVNTSDLVLSINHALRVRLQRFGREQIDLLPNATSPRISNIVKEVSILKGDLTLGYFGHLSPAWFDFKLVRKIASSQPEWVIHLIGYGDEGRASELPSNVILHGRKPQHMLASFAANWDVGIVPFHQGPLADGADPIKTYEYLSMGLPVVVSGVSPPRNADTLVYRAESAGEFIHAAKLASTEDDKDRERKEFAEANTWGSRAMVLIGHLEQGSQRISEMRELFRTTK